MTREIYDNISYINKSEDSSYFIFIFTSQQIIFNMSYFDIITTDYNLYELQFEVENNDSMTELIFKFLKG